VGLARSRDSRRRSKIAHHFLAADFGRRVIPAGVLHGSLRWISLRPLPVPDLLFSGRSPGKRSHEPSGDDDLRRGGASLLAIYSVSFPRASRRLSQEAPFAGPRSFADSCRRKEFLQSLRRALPERHPDAHVDFLFLLRAL